SSPPARSRSVTTPTSPRWHARSTTGCVSSRARVSCSSWPVADAGSRGGTTAFASCAGIDGRAIGSPARPRSRLGRRLLDRRERLLDPRAPIAVGTLGLLELVEEPAHPGQVLPRAQEL